MKIESMTKLRHQKEQSYILQNYIKETNICRVRDLIKVKLELFDIGKNQGKNRLCWGCNQVDETTEHIIACKHVKKLVRDKKSVIMNQMSDRTNYSTSTTSCRPTSN